MMAYQRSKKSSKLPLSFFTRSDTALIARELLGKILVTRFDGVTTKGIITETEAYLGNKDKACHAFDYRKTPRNQVMFNEGGCSYVYLCYGIHHLFNIVTHSPEEPHAVLIRAVEPVEGIETMLERRKKLKVDKSLTAGPGSMSQAMGIKTTHSGLSLLKAPIWVEENKAGSEPFEIVASKRIGVEYAGEHADWPLRFYIKGNKFVSK